MSDIKISELRSSGLELFQDSESFLNDLSDQEVGLIEGSDGFLVLSDLILGNVEVQTKYTVSVGISKETNSVVTYA